MAGEPACCCGAATRAALSVAMPLYAAGVAARSACFTLGLKRSYPLGRPTVSLGNLTTGGTGKTPMVVYVVQQLISAGHRPCILLRGYRGGDEAEEHRQRLGNSARVEPNPDRVSAAKAALSDDPSITCFVLDDGFQHRRAQRDLDLVLIDATNPWGFGHLLPRGLMREPKTALRRADAVILTRSDQVEPDTLHALDREIEQLTGHRCIAHAQHAWVGLRDSKSERHDLNTIADKTVMGVVGIGNPQGFERTLRQHAGRVVHCEAMPDHHRYTRKTLLKFNELAEAAGAQAIVTTEKDWVKWADMLAGEELAVPIFRAELAMRLSVGEQALQELIRSRIAKR